MKKILFITLLVLGLFILFSYLFLPRLVLSMITNYDPFTFEKVLSNPAMREDYGIYQNSRPEDYGFESEEVNFLSLDSTKLSSWYIPAKNPSSHCLILIHGRTSNRLKPMKFLALIDSLDLDSAYNIFIPDFRNSGLSQPAKTYMGYKFGEDLTASLLLLNASYHQDTFLLYGFSMGAMAILNATGRPDLKRQIEEKNIIIEKIILDSPLTNVKETLKYQSAGITVAKYFFDEVFELYSDEINGFADSMNLSTLLDRNIPTLILQSKDDATTPFNVLNLELKRMSHFDQLDTAFFNGPAHVKLFQDQRTKLPYIKAVGVFMASSKETEAND